MHHAVKRGLVSPPNLCDFVFGATFLSVIVGVTTVARLVRFLVCSTHTDLKKKVKAPQNLFLFPAFA
jgi:hypothetical protein